MAKTHAMTPTHQGSGPWYTSKSLWMAVLNSDRFSAVALGLLATDDAADGDSTSGVTNSSSVGGLSVPDVDDDDDDEVDVVSSSELFLLLLLEREDCVFFALSVSAGCSSSSCSDPCDSDLYVSVSIS